MTVPSSGGGWYLKFNCLFLFCEGGVDRGGAGQGSGRSQEWMFDRGRGFRGAGDERRWLDGPRTGRLDGRRRGRGGGGEPGVIGVAQSPASRRRRGGQVEEAAAGAARLDRALRGRRGRLRQLDH